MLIAALVVLWWAAPQDRSAVERGRKIYDEEKCSTCHQVAGQGNRTFPLDGVGTRLSDADLRRWFTHTREMEDALPRRPGIRMSSRRYDFDAEELAALVAYLRTLK
jgi:cytochrome c